MRASTLFFTVASLFLIGSHSLPQPVNLDATSSIKERQTHYQPLVLYLYPSYSQKARANIRQSRDIHDVASGH